MVLASSSCQLSSSTPSGLRVVLVTLDTLRYDAFWDDRTQTTTMPLLVARARRGLWFERAFSATSTTQPTHASLMTGRPPWEHAVLQNGVPLPADVDTLAEHLAAGGFETAAVVGSFPLARGSGFEQGFGLFDDELTRGVTRPERRPANEEGDVPFYRLGDAVTDAAIRALERLQSPRQFLWVHYFDAHSPYGDTAGGDRLSPGFILERVRAGEAVGDLLAKARTLYDTDVRSLDASLDRLLARLDADRDRFATHVVIVSDHGESFGDDGSVAHGKRLTQAQIHVPLIVLSPAVKAARRRDVAGSIDVTATLASLAGSRWDLPGARDLTAGARNGARAFGMRRTFDHARNETRIDGKAYPLEPRFFFAAEPDGTLFTGNSEGLTDSTGTAPTISPERDAELRRTFASFEASLAAHQRPAERPDAETERALRALGYAD